MEIIYFAYNDDGTFKGYYILGINEDIPESNKIKINEELWRELLNSYYKVNLEALSLLSEDKPLELKDKDKYFIEDNQTNDLDMPKDKTDVLLSEVSKTKIALMHQQQINKSLLEQSAKDKLYIMQQQEMNKNLLKSIAELKLNNMKGSN